jgi:hypothetical protein
MGNVDYWIKHRTINGLPGSASVTGKLKTQKTEQLFSQYDDNRVKLAAIQENEKAVTDKIISGKNEKVGNTDLRTLYAQYGSQLYKEGANVHPYTGQRVRGINLEIKKEIVSKYGEETWDKLTSLNKDVSSEKSKYRKEVYGAHTRLGVIDLPGVYTVGKDGNTKELTDGFVSYMNVLAKQNQLDVRFSKSTISSVGHEKRSNGKTYHLITVGGKVNDEGKLVGGETIEVEDNDVTNTRYKIKDTQFYNRVGQYTMGRLDGSKTTPTTDAGLLTSSNGSTHFAYVEDANGTFTFKIKGVKSGKVTYRTSFDKYLTNNYNPGVTKEAVLDAIDWISQNVGDIGVMTEQELANALTQYNNSK